jgi:protein-tyrosine phosphatase
LKRDGNFHPLKRAADFAYERKSHLVIDIHCHLLDSAECCPETFERSVEMCRQSVAEGVQTIVATPRWDTRAINPPSGFDEYQRRLKRLQQEVEGALSLRLGFLLGFRAELPALIEQYGSSISLGGGRYVFVSLPALRVPAEAEEVWSKISAQGFSILLARAECNLALRRDASRLERWVKSGIHLQLDAASITGLHGYEIQQFALQCVKKYEGSLVIASSVGSNHVRHASLMSAREQLLKKTDSRRVRRLFTETPAMMLEDSPKLSNKDASRSLRLPLISRLRSLRSHRAVTDES